MISKVGPVQVLLPIFEKKIKSQIPDVECITIPNAVQPFEVNKKLDSKVILNIARVMPLKNQKLINISRLCRVRIRNTHKALSSALANSYRYRGIWL